MFAGRVGSGWRTVNRSSCPRLYPSRPGSMRRWLWVDSSQANCPGASAWLGHSETQRDGLPDRSLVRGIVSPCSHRRYRLIDLGTRQFGKRARGWQHDSTRLPEFKLEHASAQGVPLQFATEAHERRLPNLDEAAKRSLFMQSHAMHRIAASRRRRVADQTGPASRHVRQKKVRDPYIRYRVPRFPRSTFVGGPGPLALSTA